MKILMINQPLNNRGDESAHKALIRTICKEIPEAHIQVLFVGTNPDSVSQFNVHMEKVEYINFKPAKAYGRIAIYGLKFKNLHFFWHLHPTIRKILHLYHENDYILCAPGGICMGGFQDWYHLFFLKLAQYCNKPLIYYGRSFGPFPTITKDNRIFKKISIEMLHYFTFLSIRDKKTEAIAKNLGINYVTTVDTAFLDSPHATAMPQEIQQQISLKNYVVFVPNLLIWHYAYKGISKNTIISFYLDVIDLIFNQYPQTNIIMLPQTFNYKTYEGDDINLFKEIKQLKKDKRIIVISDKYSSDIQQTIISKAKFLIGARYHSIVFAINNNVPFISLSYEHKMIGLLQTLGKSNFSVDISNIFDSDIKIHEALQSIQQNLQMLKNDSRTQLLAKKIAKECFTKFKFLIEEKISPKIAYQ